jgi:DNA relaxase NicK
MDNAKWLFHSASVDWLTVTFTHQEAAAGLEKKIWSFIEMEERKGNEVTPCRALGYDGFRVGKLFFGTREDGCMLRVSSMGAQDVIEALSGHTVHCTRIDIQCTYKTVPGLPMWGAWLASGVENRRAEQQPCNWPKLTHINGFGAGDTVMVGSRSSDKYGRIYDKEMESLDPDYQGCWRYEVEYKGAYAEACFEALSKSGSRSRGVEALVSSQFAMWCLPVPLVAPSDGSALIVPRETSDAQRRLNWLRKQVMPTIRKLIAQGYEQDVDDWVKACYDTYHEVT